HTIDDRFHHAACEQRYHLRFERAHRRDLLLERPRAQHGAEDANALAQHETEVHVSFRAGHEPDEHDATERLDAAQIFGDVVTADELEHDRGAAWMRGAHRIRELAAIDVDAHVHAERAC